MRTTHGQRGLGREIKFSMDTSRNTAALRVTRDLEAGTDLAVVDAAARLEQSRPPSPGSDPLNPAQTSKTPPDARVPGSPPIVRGYYLYRSECPLQQATVISLGGTRGVLDSGAAGTGLPEQFLSEHVPTRMSVHRGLRVAG